MPRRQVHANHAALAVLFVVLLQKAANLVSLDPDNGIFLLVEFLSAPVNLRADQVLVQLVAISLESLFGNKFEKTDLLGGVGKVFALDDAAKFLALFIEGESILRTVSRDQIRAPRLRKRSAIGRSLLPEHLAECKTTVMPLDQACQAAHAPGKTAVDSVRLTVIWQVIACYFRSAC